MPADFSHSAPTIITLTPTGNVTSDYHAVKMGLIEHSSYGPIGQGGWQIVDRPKMTAATQWFDRSPYQLSFQAVLDNNITTMPVVNQIINSSVEDDCLQLESWMDKVDGKYQPPIISVSGPIPGIQRLWVLYKVDFADAIRDFAGGFRIQQMVNVTLYEYSPPVTNTLSNYSYAPTQTFVESQNPSDKSGTQQYLLYTIKDDDSLIKIANKFYNSNDPKFVEAIKTLNGIRDDASVGIGIMTGQIIKLPRM